MNGRTLAALLSLSAAGLVGILAREGYTDRAVIPVEGDPPTVGFGSTKHEDGTPVRPSDTTTPVRALIKAQAHISREEQAFRDSLPGVKLHQVEYDIFVSWLYQYGIGRWRKSSMRRHLLAGDYRAACDALLLYKYAGGYDCSTLIDGRPNKRCWGVWARQLERHEKCLAAQ